MPKLKEFTVLLTRDITESALIIVRAETKEGAFEEAYDQRLDADTIWETNDGIGETYMCDPANDIEEMEL